MRIHAVTEAQAIAHVLAESDAGRGGVVVTPNLDHLRRCTYNPGFAALVAEADLVVADGMPLIWASRLQGTPLPQRVAGSDLILTLSQAAGSHQKRVFLLGGAPGTADAAAKLLEQKCPGISVVGNHCPPMGYEHDELEMARIVRQLTESEPDIVYVALGSPKQEHLIDQLRPTLPRAWFLGVGVSFSFLTGHVKRAPRWLQVIGLEWTHRLVQEPRRLFRRYLIEGIPFAGRLLGGAMWNRLSGQAVIEPGESAGSLAATLASERAQGAPALSKGRSVGRNSGQLNGHHKSAVAEMSFNAFHRSETLSHQDVLSRLRAVVLLGGHVRPSGFDGAIARSVMDLPTINGTLLDRWLADASRLAEYARLEHLPVRVLVGTQGAEPKSCRPYEHVSCSIERDGSNYRGTGGVLADIARAYADDDMLLVANARQVLLDPLTAIAAALAHKSTDFSLVSHVDGSPSNVMLFRCACLRKISPEGFVDLKEQALPAIARNFDVRAIHCRVPCGLPVRDDGEYLKAMRALARQSVAGRSEPDPMAEDWQRSFAIVEPGAAVDSSAYIHDSIVLAGARVEAGASVVRSIVCPGALVKPGRKIIDELLEGVPA